MKKCVYQIANKSICSSHQKCWCIIQSLFVQIITLCPIFQFRANIYRPLCYIYRNKVHWIKSSRLVFPGFEYCKDLAELLDVREFAFCELCSGPNKQPSRVWRSVSVSRLGRRPDGRRGASDCDSLTDAGDARTYEARHLHKSRFVTDAVHLC